MKRNWINEYLEMIKDCENRESRMTEWECKFISSLRDKLELTNPFPLTEKQVEKLDDIWNRITEEG